LGRVLEKIVQRRLVLLTADIIPKQQFGERNGFSTADAFAKLISYTKVNQSWNRVTSILAIDILRFPLAHGYFHGKFGAIERLDSLRALTPLLCQSHRDKCFLKFHVFFVCHFVL